MLLAVDAGQVCHCRFVLADRLAEADIGLGHQHVDGLQLRDRRRRRRLIVRSTRKICRDAAGTERDGQDDNAGGIHTLYLLLRQDTEFCLGRSLVSKDD